MALSRIAGVNVTEFRCRRQAPRPAPRALFDYVDREVARGVAEKRSRFDACRIFFRKTGVHFSGKCFKVPSIRPPADDFIGGHGSMEAFQVEVADMAGLDHLLDDAEDPMADQDLARLGLVAQTRG